MLKYVLPFPVMFLAATAFAGSGSHGGDLRDPEAEAAWFEQKDGVIHYCVDVAPDFELTASAALSDIAAAFTAWKNYIAFTRVPSYYQIFAGELTKDAEPMMACDGSEDVAFHLGTMPTAVKAEIPHYNDPIAFAHRTAFDSVTGWGKGFVWIGKPRTVTIGGGIAPVTGKIAWTTKNAFRVLVTHELGHVFGNEHIASTVMTEDIAYYLIVAGGVPNLPKAPLLTSIDWDREVVACSEARMCADDKVYGGVMSKEVAAHFLGNPSGPDLAVQVVSKIHGNALAADALFYEIRIYSNGEWHAFPVKRRDTIRIDRNAAFHRVTKAGVKTASWSDAIVMIGTVEPTGQTPLTLIIQQNTSDNTRLAISAEEWFLTNSYDRTVFVAVPDTN